MQPSRRAAARARSLRPFLPWDFASLLGRADVADIRLGDHVEQNITVLFSDIRDFTTLSESMSPTENFRLINAYFRHMEPAVLQSHGIVDKYIGDAIMALFPRTADDGVRAGLGLLRRLRGFNARFRRGQAPLRIGVGLNTGLVMAGALGSPNRIETTVISDAVNLASRLESLTRACGVSMLISEHTLYSLRRPDAYHIRFIDRVRVKGKEQPESVYEVFDADPPALRLAKRNTRALFEEALACYHSRQVTRARTLLRKVLAESPDDAAALLYLDRCRRFARTGVHEDTGEIGRPIVWGQEYRLGHERIDGQHRMLFDQVNRFMRSVRAARRGADVQKFAAFLHRYVEEHFATEEEAMRQAKYPLLPLQRQQHERFRRDFAILEAQLKERLDTQRTFMLFRIQLLVVDWLAHHTMKLDRHFGRFLAHRPASRRRKAVPVS